MYLRVFACLHVFVYISNMIACICACDCMYMCMWLHVFAYLHVFACTHTYLHAVHAFTCLYLCFGYMVICIYVFTCVSWDLCFICAFTWICMIVGGGRLLHVFNCMHMCLSVCIRFHVFSCICMYLHGPTCIVVFAYLHVFSEIYMYSIGG